MAIAGAAGPRGGLTAWAHRMARPVLVVTLFWAAVIAAVRVLGAVRSGFFGDDFAQYYFGARLAQIEGWPNVYDRSLQALLMPRLIGLPLSATTGFIYPPPIAWLVTPLLALDEPRAYAAWAAVMIAAFVLSWRLLAGSGWLWLLALAGCAPVVGSVLSGQPHALIFLGCALCVRLTPRRPVLAGALLAPLLLKPHLALLVPTLLLLAGRRRVALGLGLVALPVAAICWLQLGEAGSISYLRAVAAAGNVPFNAEISLAGHLPAGLKLPFQLLVVAACGWRAVHLRGEIGPLLALGLVGSLAISGYLHGYDLSLIVLAALMVNQAGAGRAAVGRLAVVVGLTDLAPPLLLQLAPGLALAALLYPAGLLDRTWPVARPGIRPAAAPAPPGHR